MSERPTFHEIFLDLATSLARRSTCLRLQVGAVITSVDFRSVYAVGYNGNACQLDNKCDRTGPDAVGNCGCLHAEENAVINCDVPRSFHKLVYCTHLPCVMCAKRLINLGGVKWVFYLQDCRDKTGIEILHSAHINTLHANHLCRG